MKKTHDESTNWANNAVNLLSQLSKAPPEFVAGTLAVAAMLADEFLQSSKQPGVNKENFGPRVGVALARAKMILRGMRA